MLFGWFYKAKSLQKATFLVVLAYVYVYSQPKAVEMTAEEEKLQPNVVAYSAVLKAYEEVVLVKMSFAYEFRWVLFIFDFEMIIMF